MVSSSEAFIAHVAAHAGVAANEAELATRAVLGRIGGALTPERRQLIADELPAALATAMLAPKRIIDDAPASHQRELVACVYRVLAEELSRDALGWLRDELPAPVAELLVEGAAPAEPAPHGTHETLAEGRPGSTHPLSQRRR